MRRAELLDTRLGEANVRSRRAMENIGGMLISWDETITAFGREMRFIAYEITRDVFVDRF